MKKLLLNIYILLMLLVLTLLFILLFPLSATFQMVFFKRNIDYAIRWSIFIYGWLFVRVVPFFAPVTIEYKTAKKPSPAIIVANHRSIIDPYLFGVLLTDVIFLSTWPFKIPIYGFFMRLAKYIDANEGWERICQKGEEMLRSGVSLIIWPEGHRSRNGRLGRFKNGAFALAVKSGYPLLPVCILGSEKFLPPGKKLMSPSRIRLVVMDPIYPDLSSNPEEEIIRLRSRAKEVIEQTLQEDMEQTGELTRAL